MSMRRPETISSFSNLHQSSLTETPILLRGIKSGKTDSDIFRLSWLKKSSHRGPNIAQTMFDRRCTVSPDLRPFKPSLDPIKTQPNPIHTQIQRRNCPLPMVEPKPRSLSISYRTLTYCCTSSGGGDKLRRRRIEPVPESFVPCFGAR
jgi:hypothetical protein